MRAHPLLLKPLRAGRQELAGADAGHLIRVLRVRPGARVRAFDGDGLEADGTVVAVDGLRLELELEPPRPSTTEAPLSVTVAVSLLKGDKLAEVIRHGTELGVVAFRLFVSRRSDVRELGSGKLERLRRVAREAAKQCGRAVVPTVEPPLPLSDLPLAGLALVADPRADRTVHEILPPGEPAPDCVTVVSGPEGGLSDEEVRELTARGAVPVRLGARILRAETAPLAVTAALLVPRGW